MHHIGKSDKGTTGSTWELMKNIIFKTNINLGAGNSFWLSLRGRKPLKKLLEVGCKPSLLTGFIYIANLIVISVFKIGFSRLLHVIVLLLYNTVSYLATNWC